MKVLLWFLKFRPKSANKFGWFIFQLGLFFLASSAFLGGLLLLISIIFGSLKRKHSFWKDFWNYPFIFSSFLMLIGSIKAYSGWLAWAGLANWLPFFWGFWAFQPYLKTAQSRRRAALCLLAGTFPVVITGFGQLWFGWEGPWQILNGFIIWFITPDGNPEGRFSGLFNYANVAGAWLAIIWPFGLAALLQPFLNKLQKSVAFVWIISIIAALILTDSRNAWNGLVLAIPFVLGTTHWFWLLPLMIVICTLIGLSVLPGVDLEVQNWARKIIPESIWSRLNDMKYASKRYLASTRLFQWQTAIKLVSERPWLGWGAAAFSILFPLLTSQGIWLGHAHNLPLEIAVSHGIPVAAIMTGGILALLITALKRGVLTVPDKSSDSFGLTVFDRAWWASSLILICLHSVDMPVFDSRINLAGWVLLAGVRCILISLKPRQICKSNYVNQSV